MFFKRLPCDKEENENGKFYSVLVYEVACSHVKELHVSEEDTSVYITTVNKEKYRCLLPSISETKDKVSICVNW